jgi:hypothetical protein
MLQLTPTSYHPLRCIITSPDMSDLVRPHWTIFPHVAYHILGLLDIPPCSQISLDFEERSLDTDLKVIPCPDISLHFLSMDSFYCRTRTSPCLSLLNILFPLVAFLHVSWNDRHLHPFLSLDSCLFFLVFHPDTAPYLGMTRGVSEGRGARSACMSSIGSSLHRRCFVPGLYLMISTSESLSIGIACFRSACQTLTCSAGMLRQQCIGGFVNQLMGSSRSMQVTLR